MELAQVLPTAPPPPYAVQPVRVTACCTCACACTSPRTQRRHTNAAAPHSASSSPLAPSAPPTTNRPTARAPTLRNPFRATKAASAPCLAQAIPPAYVRVQSHSHIRRRAPTPVHSRSRGHAVHSESEDDDGAIYVAPARGAQSRFFAPPTAPARTRYRPISTAPGALRAGETETETDEPSAHLPTARIVRAPPGGLTPLLCEAARLLSVVPAVCGALYNLYHVYSPPHAPACAARIDFLVSALWAILTGHQCLALATGLLARWRVYYPPLATLVRLLALQAICWPATHATLNVVGHSLRERPVVVWALVGTTTCASRSVQMWATSNLCGARGGEGEGGDGGGNANASLNSGGGGTRDASGAASGPCAGGGADKERRRHRWRRWGPWGGRRWDWRAVGVRCALPAGVLYFVTAWAELLRREWEGAACVR